MNFTIFSRTQRKQVKQAMMYLSQDVYFVPARYLVRLWVNSITILTNVRSARIKEPIATVPIWYTRVILKEVQTGELGIALWSPFA